MKCCTKCNLLKDLSEFYTKGKKIDGILQSECKLCFNNRMKIRWQKHKDRLLSLKGSSCELCGYNKCSAALEFHHVDSDEKEFAISKGYSYSLEKLKEELEKCILVCANCHREIHNKGL